VLVVLWLSLTLGVVTPRGEKKKRKLVEKGMVRKDFWLITVDFGAVRQPTSRGLCRVQEWGIQTGFGAGILLRGLQVSTVSGSLCQQKERRQEHSSLTAAAWKCGQH